MFFKKNKKSVLFQNKIFFYGSKKINNTIIDYICKKPISVNDVPYNTYTYLFITHISIKYKPKHTEKI